MNIKIHSMAMIRQPKREKEIALVDVCFNDFLIIKGFRLCMSGDFMFLDFPKNLPNEKIWWDTIEFTEQCVMKTIVELVISKYRSLEEKRNEND